MRGKPVILNNCEDHIDNIITPLMHHRNTANPKDEEEGNYIIFIIIKPICSLSYTCYRLGHS